MREEITCKGGSGVNGRAQFELFKQITLDIEDNVNNRESQGLVFYLLVFSVI